MKGRIPANSESLKKHFPEVYKELFSKCSVVVSAPGSFWWTGAYSVLEGNIGILQKIPLRVYVGLEETRVGKVKIATFQYYEPFRKKFYSNPLEEPASTKLLTFLSGLEEIKEKHGIIAHFLLEVPPGRGLNSSSALSSALAFALNLIFHKIKAEDQKYLMSNNLEETHKNKAFDEIFKLGWKIDNIFHGIASGAGVFSSMLHATYPVIYFVEKIRLSPESIKSAWNNRFNYVDHLDYFGARLNEVISLPETPNWPIDFGLIFSGSTDTTILTSQSTFERREELWEMKKYLNKTIKSRQIKRLMSQNQYFGGDKYRLWRTYIDPMQINAFEAIYALKEVFEKGLSEKALLLFFGFITRTHDLLQMLGFSSITTEKICQIVIDQLTTNNHKMAATSITGGSQKGDILFVAPYNTAQNKIIKLINKLQSELSENISLDYASWTDGFEDEGVRLEQHLDEKIYSDFISAGSIKLTHFSKSGFSHSDIYTLEEFQKKRKTIDVLIDTVENEIYIKGKLISSKYLPSSKTTIKVLQALIDKLGKEVPAAVFGDSSYFKDRNELQSKIVSPLNREIKKRLKKELPLEIHGGIDNFTIKLSQPPFEILVVERIF